MGLLITIFRTARSFYETVLIGGQIGEKSRDDPGKCRGERFIAKLRNDNLNSKDKDSLHELCFNYQDKIILPGEKLSCKTQPGMLYSWRLC